MDLVKSITEVEYNITNDYFVGEADLKKNLVQKKKDLFSGVLVLIPITLQSNRFAIQFLQVRRTTRMVFLQPFLRI